MRLSDLQNKNLVNTSDGKNIGNIVDVNIDYKSGNINSFIIESISNSSFITNTSLYSLYHIINLFLLFENTSESTPKSVLGRISIEIGGSSGKKVIS